jgi:PmbA protein
MVGIEETAKRLLSLVEKAGVDEGEIYVQRTEGLEISLRDQEVERLRNKAEGGFALRLISGNRMGFLHSSDFRDDMLASSVERCVELTRAAQPDESNQLPGVSETEPQVEICDDTISSITYDRKLSLLRDVETLAFAYDPSISKIEYLSYGDARTETLVANTNGLYRHGESTKFSISLSVVAEKEGDVETGGERAESRFFEDLDPPSKIASRACWKATSLLGGKTVPTQTVPVIFDRDVGHTLLAHLFAMVKGSSVADRLSALEGKIGEVIGSETVTVVDDPTLDRGVGSRGFDSEGTGSARTVVIDRGVLRSFLFDSRSAKKAGFASTGNAKRDSFRDLPTVGHSNFFIERGENSPDDIIGATDKGLWLVDLAGWWVGVNPATGDFSSGAKGLWVDVGEVAYPVRNVTVASNVLDMLQAIDMLGNDLYFRHETCAPTLRVAEMKVGGV